MNRNVLILEPFSGISGDMMIACLLDLGLTLDYLKQSLDKLGLKDWGIESRRVRVNGIMATKFSVEHLEQHSHRTFRDIKNLINAAALSGSVKAGALKVFGILAAAESMIHGEELDNVHFHEVGALDSIVDIVGVAIGIEFFGINDIFSFPPRLGTGFVKSGHGILPVPAPATAEILRDFPVIHSDIPFEFTTPTGASILKALARPFNAENIVKYNKIGYGAGSKTVESIPNILRAYLLNEESELKESKEFCKDEIAVLETNIDDMIPEQYSYVMEKLLSMGALDVFYTPVVMKHSRPGTQITVLCHEEKAATLAGFIMQETTTLGLRWSRIKRMVLKRQTIKVMTTYGEISVKVAESNKGRFKIAPEFRDAAKAAEENDVPINDVYDIARSKAIEMLSGKAVIAEEDDKI